MRKKTLWLLCPILIASGAAGAVTPTASDLREQLTAELRADPGLHDSDVAVRLAPDPSAIGGPALRTVRVDCARPRASINRALRRRAQELIIEIQGICVENVVVERDRVTLRGIDPATDGIQAAGNGDPVEAALLIRHARRVRVENLQLTNSTWSGLRVVNARDSIEVDNCLITGNAERGADIIDADTAFWDVTVTGNGANPPSVANGGLFFGNGARGRCTRCTIENNPVAGSNTALLAFQGSEVRVFDSDLEGRLAVVAQLHSSITFYDSSTITGSVWAIWSNYFSHVTALNTIIDGPLAVFKHAGMRLGGVIQSLGPIANSFEDGALVEIGSSIGQPSVLATDISVTRFSNLQVRHGSTIANLTCTVGSDAYCDGSETKGTVTGCTLCP